MPLYQQTILVVPKRAPEKLVDLFKTYTRTILRKGGVVRSIENHGLRPLPQRTTR